MVFQKKIISIIYLFFLVLFVPSTLLSADENAINSANQIGRIVTQKFSTKEGINTNINAPLMSDAPMKTLDNSKSFNARLVCSGQAKFMTLFTQPSGTGDLTNTILSQDLNLDGTMDYNYSINIPISGVCSNGLISCTPGTWTNCVAYRWNSDDTGKITLVATNQTNLGGCFCINSSCGSNLPWNNLSIILQTLGGGAANAIRTGNSRMAISDVKIDGSFANYYGQNTRNCNTVSAQDGNLEALYSNPAALTSNVETTVASQQATPGSMYNILYSAYQISSQADIRQCSIIRTAIPKWDENSNCYALETIDNRCTELDNDPNCKLRDEKVDNVITFNNFINTGLTPLESCITLNDVLHASCSYNCPINSHLPCTGEPPTCSDGNATYNCQTIQPIVNIQSYNFQYSTWGCTLECEGNGCLVGLHFNTDPVVLVYGLGDNKLYFMNSMTGTIKYKVVNGNVYYTDLSNCSPNFQHGHLQYIEFQPGIKVWGKTVIGWCGTFISSIEAGVDPQGTPYTGGFKTYYTYEKYYDFGNIYFQGLTSIGSGICNGDIFILSATSTNWDFSSCIINIGYGNSYGRGNLSFIPNICPIDTNIQCLGNPSYCTKQCELQVCRDWWRKERTYICKHDAYDFSQIQQRAKTIKESAAKTDNNLYYRDYRDREYSTYNLNISGSYEQTNNECIKACKTKKTVQDTRTTMTKISKEYLSDTQTSYEYYYKICTNNVCPVETGETIVKDCRCMDDFAEAASIMQLFRAGGQDIICSTGVPKPIK